MKRVLRKGLQGGLVAAAMLPCVAPAAEWQNAVTVPAGVEHDSNPTMAAAGAQGVTRYTLTPNYTLVRTTGADEWRAVLGLRIERSSNVAISANRQDPTLNAAWRRQGPTGEFGVKASYAEASTRVTELAETGTVQRDGTTKTGTVGANGRLSLTERTFAAADAEVKQVSYDGGTLVGYTNTTLGATLGYAWSELVEPYLRATASHYQPRTGPQPSSDNATLLGGVKWKLHENFEASAQAGLVRVSGATRDTDWLGNVTLRSTGARIDASLDLARAVTPSGQGGFVTSNQFKGTVGYALDERSRAGLDASWNDNKGLQPNTLRTLGLWASRELSPFWNARIYWTGKQRKQVAQPDATGTVAGIALVYSHPDF